MGLALKSHLLRRHGLDSGTVGVVYTRGKRDIPEVHIRRQLALDEIFILHRGVMEGHRRLEQFIFTSTESLLSLDNRSAIHQTHTWKTSSAVLRTMNDLGSD